MNFEIIENLTINEIQELFDDTVLEACNCYCLDKTYFNELGRRDVSFGYNCSVFGPTARIKSDCISFCNSLGYCEGNPNLDATFGGESIFQLSMLCR